MPDKPKRAKKPQEQPSGPANQFDDVLRRMLATPPAVKVEKPRKPPKRPVKPQHGEC